MQKCENCPFAENYKSKLQNLQTLLGGFPPYHGASFNYTKQEVEEWLEKAKAEVGKELNSRYL
jgi:hypothetical protein